MLERAVFYQEFDDRIPDISTIPVSPGFPTLNLISSSYMKNEKCTDLMIGRGFDSSEKFGPYPTI